jgi:DNA-directed RNA polymerase specialized sigma24 family protein
VYPNDTTAPDGQGDSFEDVFAQLLQGSDQGAAHVFHRFAHRLAALSAPKLAGFRRKVDPEDVVQSVMRTFFRRAAGGEFELSSWDNLWALLAHITCCKTSNCVKHFLRQRRDAGRESEPGDGVSLDPVSLDPSPEDLAALTELLHAMLDPMPEDQREIVAHVLLGRKDEEVADLLGTAEEVVRTLRERFGKQLKRRHHLA